MNLFLPIIARHFNKSQGAVLRLDSDACDGLTGEQVPEVVGFEGLLFPAPARFAMTDLVSGDEPVLRVCRRRLPAHLNALRHRREANTDQTHISLSADARLQINLGSII